MKKAIEVKADLSELYLGTRKFVDMFPYEHSLRRIIGNYFSSSNLGDKVKTLKLKSKKYEV